MFWQISTAKLDNPYTDYAEKLVKIQTDFPHMNYSARYAVLMLIYRKRKELGWRGFRLSKSELLDAVAVEVVVCRRCGLWKSRKNAVPGEGSPDSHVMFIGEAPGHWEDVEGKPFVGAAGKFLDTLLSEAGLSRKTVFIGNILKCRPPKNREPLPDEIRKCTPYLDRQIRIIQPKYVVTPGNYSTGYVFSRVTLPFKGITQARGKFYETSILGLNVTIFPTFHPAAALYHPKYKEQLIRDFHTLKNKLAEKTPS